MNAAELGLASCRHPVSSPPLLSSLLIPPDRSPPSQNPHSFPPPDHTQTPSPPPPSAFLSFPSRAADDDPRARGPGDGVLLTSTPRAPSAPASRPWRRSLFIIFVCAESAAARRATSRGSARYALGVQMGAPPLMQLGLVRHPPLSRATWALLLVHGSISAYWMWIPPVTCGGGSGPSPWAGDPPVLAQMGPCPFYLIPLFCPPALVCVAQPSPALLCASHGMWGAAGHGAPTVHPGGQLGGQGAAADNLLRFRHVEGHACSTFRLRDAAQDAAGRAPRSCRAPPGGRWWGAGWPSATAPQQARAHSRGEPASPVRWQSRV